MCVFVGLLSEEPERVGSIKVWTPTKKLTGDESKSVAYSKGLASMIREGSSTFCEKLSSCSQFELSMC